MSKKGGTGKFLVGAAIGAGLGLLFAPKTGEETRKQLKAKLDDLYDKVKDIDADDIKNKIDELKSELMDLDGEEVLAIAKLKAQEIKKKSEDLVKLAVKKAEPVLEQAAKDIKAKTVIVLEETIKKLEEPDAKKKNTKK